MKKKQITDFIITSLAKHPYLVSFFICLFINPFFYCSINFIPTNTITIVVISLITIATLIGYYKYKKKEINFIYYYLFVLFETILIFCVSFNFESKVLFVFIVFNIVLLFLYNYLDKLKYRLQVISLLIIGSGLTLSFCYVLGTSIHQRQNDVWYPIKKNGKIIDKGGHVSYIKFIQENHKIPDCDVREKWQFAHPPLHHIICAIWLEINEKILNINEYYALESIQILTFFYTICIIISSYKIFKYFKLTGIPLYCSLTIICFFPAFILLSGSINNDVLSVAFIVATMLNALYWKQNQTTKNILNIALCFGLGMMAKISTGALAPALFVLFISTFIKSANKKFLLKQFILFLIVSVPLGTWFTIKNYITYKIPFDFVHSLDTVEDCKPQYIGDKTFFERITDFSLNQFDSVYVQNKQWGCIRNDYNPMIVLMKSALFGEFITESNFKKIPIINKVSFCFFIIFIIITLISIYSMFYIIIKNIKEKKFSEDIFFMFIFFITLIFALYRHSYKGLYVPYMAFRFITPTIIISQLFWGLLNKEYNFIKYKYYNVISISLSLVFALCSIIIYLALVF